MRAYKEIISKQFHSVLWCCCNREFTKPLESICHRLVFRHVNKPSTQTEVRKDQKDLLEDPVDLI